jgi:hypothetical protein
MYHIEVTSSVLQQLLFFQNDLKEYEDISSIKMAIYIIIILIIYLSFLKKIYAVLIDVIEIVLGNDIA